MHGDSAGHARVPFGLGATDTGSVSLFRDGSLVSTHEGSAGRFDVAAEPAAYRLVTEVSRTTSWWPLWTRVSAAWTFRSSAADEGKELPLLTARFDPAVDLLNPAPGGQRFSFPAYVERQGETKPKITAFNVDVSYDDGTTWRPAAVKASADHWTVTVDHPATGYASLRAKATDSAGNTVEQITVRAYQITARTRSQ